MKSILIVSHAWHEENFGGAFKLAGEFAQYLANLGYDVHFLCGTEQANFSNPTHKDRMQIWRYRFPKAASPSPANLWGHLYETYMLTRKIAREVDIQYLNGHSPLQFLATSYGLRGSHCRKIYSVHSPFVEELKVNWEIGEVRSQESGVSFKKQFALCLVRQLEKMIYQQADRIQCDSAYSLSVIQKQYFKEVGNKGIVCPGWVDLERFHPAGNRDEIRKRLGNPWKSGVPTFLSVRRLERRMGLDNLVDACGILKKEGYSFQLLIGGSGPLRYELKSEISRLGLYDTVHLLGRISEENLPLTYAATDCFVLPTRALECFGLIVLEAYACHTPVIATPIGSIPEVMGEYANGWLTSDTSANAIAGRMRVFLNSELQTDSVNLRNHAMLYSESSVLPKLEGVIFE